MSWLPERSRLAPELSEGRFRLAQGEQPDQPAIRCRDGQIRQLLALHPVHHRFEPCAGPDRARPKRHRLLGGDVFSAADRSPSDPAENDPPLVDDEAGVPAARIELFADCLEAIARAAGRNIRPDMGSRARLAPVLALERQSGAPPVGLAGDVVVHVLEPDALEPRRGSWAHVSLVVVAVDDDRALAVELSRAPAVELFERDVD